MQEIEQRCVSGQEQDHVPHRRSGPRSRESSSAHVSTETRYNSGNRAEHYEDSDRRRWSRQCSEVQQLQCIEKVTEIPVLTQSRSQWLKRFQSATAQAVQNRCISCTRLLTRRCCCQGDEIRKKKTQQCSCDTLQREASLSHAGSTSAPHFKCHEACAGNPDILPAKFAKPGSRCPC